MYCIIKFSSFTFLGVHPRRNSRKNDERKNKEELYVIIYSVNFYAVCSSPVCEILCNSNKLLLCKRFLQIESRDPLYGSM